MLLAVGLLFDCVVGMQITMIMTSFGGKIKKILIKFLAQVVTHRHVTINGKHIISHVPFIQQRVQDAFNE